MKPTRSITVFLPLLAVLATACRHDGTSSASAPKDSETHADAKPDAIIVARNDRGEAVVRLDKDTVARLGIETAAMTATTRHEEVAAFGRVVDDPDGSSIVRSPIAGYLRAEEGITWPTLGTALAEHVQLAHVEPRLTEIERTDVAARLATARGELEASQAAVEAADNALKRARTLNTNDKNVSDRVVEEAVARVKSESIRRDAAKAAIAVFEPLLKLEAASNTAVPITTVRAGEVVEVLAKPGDFVDAGAPIVRAQSLNDVLVRVELPFDDLDVTATGTVRLVSLASAGRTFEARVRGVDPRVDPLVQRRAIQVVITKPEATSAEAWRAIAPRVGESMKVYFAKSSVPLAGFEAPATALLHHAGKSWIWLQTSDGEFTRKHVALVDGSTSAFTNATWAKDARVVVKGAQALLSAEIFAREPNAAGDDE